MHSKLIPYKLDDGTIIFAEIHDENGDYVDASETSEEEALNFIEKLEGLRKAVFVIIDKLKELSPDEMQIKLSVKMAGRTGWIIAAASGEGNLEISLRWRKNEQNKTK